MLIYSSLKRKIECSFQQDLSVPLASTAKVVLGYWVARLVEENVYKWTDEIKEISFNPKEDSKELYPHFQKRYSLSLEDAVEVMIACHDSYIANHIVEFCGGWKNVSQGISCHFSKINVTQNPRDIKNNGELNQLLEVLKLIFEGYDTKPEIWNPIINGLVRQRGEIEGIPHYHLNHITGGLDTVVVDIGIIGEFSNKPFLYVLAAKELPNRLYEQHADEIIMEVLRNLYKEYYKQDCNN
ncbi:class A beta-lactamase-related serine hydrolase [Cytobacillus gottheilii]|uniref:class A beta-lactamase-related serine hydrolase n=1 Tax=Cytobacillus gottheilii TaxID=859144 RepID=UPI0021483D0C|nr:class A beta-lactamase-related serine hydrolase [Cytobacillus gottheilii]